MNATASVPARRLLRSPLYRNGVALVINSSVSSVVGAGYWYVAAHKTSQATVGQLSALVAALMALSTISQLSLPSVLVSYLPRTHAIAQRLVARAYAGAIVLSLLLGAAFAVLSPHLSPAFEPLAGLLPAAFFALAVASWSVFALQDNALTGLRRAVWVPIENTLYSSVKLIALLAFGTGLGAMGLFATWTIPAAIAVLPVSTILFWRLLPHHTRSGRGDDLAGLRGYFAGDTLGLIFSSAATMLLPVLVAIRLGPTEAGAFAIPWMLAQSLDLVAINLGMSLTVEGSHDEKRLASMLRALRARTLSLVVGLAAAGAIFAPQILGIFGSAYTDGATLLRLLVLGSVARVFVVLAICAARARRQPRRIVRIQAGIAMILPSAWLLAGPFGLAGVGIAWAAAQTLVGVAAFLTETGRRRDASVVGPIRTVLCANHWHDDNKGDSAITSGIVSLVRERWPLALVRVATLNEPQSPSAAGQMRHLRAAHGVVEEHSFAPTEQGSANGADLGGPRAAGRWLWRLAPIAAEILARRPRAETRRRLADVDLLIMVGGSNIYDNPDVRAPMSLARLVQVLYPAWAAGRLNIPVVLAGHTLGPFPRRLGRAIARHMLRSVHRTALREPTSIEIARALSLKEPAIRPDLAFATQARSTTRVQQTLEALPAPAGDTIALVVRRHPHAGIDADRRLVRAFADVGREAVRTGLASGILVVAHAHGPTPIEDDRPLSAELRDELVPTPVSYLDHDLAPDELAAVYGSCRLVVTVRLHAAILALSQGVPAFAVAYMTRKTEGVMAAAGLPDAWCAFNDADAATIMTALPALAASATRTTLASRREEWLSALRAEVVSWDQVGRLADPGPPLATTPS